MMRLAPRDLEVGLDEGFTKENDLFNRKTAGLRLCSLIQSHETPVVAVLDGPWGTGKSTFARQVVGELRKEHATVIYFDAFANDHHQDPFLALAAEIAEAAQSGRDPLDVSTFCKTVATWAGSLAQAAAPAAVGLVLRTASGGLLDGNAVVTSLAEAVSNSLTNHLEERLKYAAREKKELEGVREELKKIVSEFSTRFKSQHPRKKEYPLVFIIDELDRCRPDFAVGILEIIKHFYSVQGIFFLIVTNMRQMEDGIRGIYGESIDARMYLQKFISFRIDMPRHNDTFEKISIRNFIVATWGKLNINNFPELSSNVNELVDLCLEKSLSLRSIQKIVTNYALANLSDDRMILSWPEITVLMCASRELDQNLYNKLVKKEATTQMIENFYRDGGFLSAVHGNYDIWRFLTNDNTLESSELTQLSIRFRGKSQETIRDIPNKISALFSELTIEAI